MKDGHRPRSLTLRAAAELVSGHVEGDGNIVFTRLAPVQDAVAGDLALLGDRRYLRRLDHCGADALLVSEELQDAPGGPPNRLVVQDAQEALQALLAVLHPDPDPGDHRVHPTAVVHPSAVVGEHVELGPCSVVGEGAHLGDRVRVGANCVVGEGARVGVDCVLYPNVTLYPRVTLGARVLVHSGTRIGSDGFGYVLKDGAHLKIAQVGECVVEDDVEIGANCTIDRGSIGRTVIGTGSKLDNLIHIAHNVRIGPRSLIVAQVGIAGSTEVGADAILGGQAGIVGHLTIGPGARIGAQAGVIGDVAAGATVSGYPARNHRDYLRAMASLMKVPKLLGRLRALEQGHTDGATSDE
ncbi:MAG: UDP-3-O-(3-hydroxymyristoyl)glucosamine N-acyltransferase [Longimicrobiales bacterium]